MWKKMQRIGDQIPSSVRFGIYGGVVASILGNVFGSFFAVLDTSSSSGGDIKDAVSKLFYTIGIWQVFLFLPTLVFCLIVTYKFTEKKGRRFSNLLLSPFFLIFTNIAIVSLVYIFSFIFLGLIN